VTSGSEKEPEPVFKQNRQANHSPGKQWPDFCFKVTKTFCVSYKTQEANMELGAFSVSLAVKDIEASKLFYEKLRCLIQTSTAKKNMNA
jgi:hypothetical protein